MVYLYIAVFLFQLDDWVLCRIYRKSHVSLPTSAGAASDHDLEEEEEKFNLHDTLLPILRSPPSHNTTLNPQKSSSFSNLLDAMDYSMLSNFLSENQTSHTGSESNPLFNSGILEQHHSSFNNGNGNGANTNTSCTNSFLIQKLPQLNYSVSNNMENQQHKRPHPNIDHHENMLHPSKKFITTCSFSSSTTDQFDPPYNYLHQPFLTQQLLLSPHLQFQG